jgi:hypothetical protein
MYLICEIKNEDFIVRDRIAVKAVHVGSSVTARLSGQEHEYACHKENH